MTIYNSIKKAVIYPLIGIGLIGIVAGCATATRNFESARDYALETNISEKLPSECGCVGQGMPVFLNEDNPDSLEKVLYSAFEDYEANCPRFTGYLPEQISSIYSKPKVVQGALVQNSDGKVQMIVADGECDLSNELMNQGYAILSGGRLTE